MFELPVQEISLHVNSDKKSITRGIKYRDMVVPVSVFYIMWQLKALLAR